MGYLRNNGMFTFGKGDRARTSATFREILDAMWLFNDKFERARARFEEIEAGEGPSPITGTDASGQGLGMMELVVAGLRTRRSFAKSTSSIEAFPPRRARWLCPGRRCDDVSDVGLARRGISASSTAACALPTASTAVAAPTPGPTRSFTI